MLAANYSHHGMIMPLAFMRPHLSLPASPHADALAALDIPTAFDSRTAFATCKASIAHIRNQGSCGSCWAFAAVESLADRFCIKSGGKVAPTLSAESLIDCDKSDSGCSGGYLDNAWEGLASRGALAESCDPYEHCAYPPFPNCTNPGLGLTAPSPPPLSSCPEQCASGSALKWYKAANAYAVGAPGDVAAMQRELMAHGPFEVAFFVYPSFYKYTGGIYKKASNESEPMGGHAVKLVGWGEVDGVPYWTIANSWSPMWGDDGFFKILRGTNECGIETTPAAGLPDVQAAPFASNVAVEVANSRGALSPAISAASHMDAAASTSSPPSRVRAAAGKRLRPTVQTQFSATMRVSESDQAPGGGAGDGCILARKLSDPVKSQVWFDAASKRLAQVNANLEHRPIKELTVVTRLDLSPPLSYELEPFFNSTVCYKEKLGPGYCPNGTMGCPPTFGHFGDYATPFTSVLGMYYLNTSFLELDATTGDEKWRWTSVQPTLMPNGTTVNITRNYTYYVAPPAPMAEKSAQPRPLHRFEWTQGLPNAGDPSFRFCAVFDYTQDYRAGAPDISHFGPPSSDMCINPSSV